MSLRNAGPADACSDWLFDGLWGMSMGTKYHVACVEVPSSQNSLGPTNLSVDMQVRMYVNAALVEALKVARFSIFAAITNIPCLVLLCVPDRMHLSVVIQQ